MIGGVATAVIATTALILLLVFFGSGSNADRNQLDAIRTAVGIVLGTGGAVALILAARRQRYAELTLKQQYEALDQQERDSTSRRVTDLYTKAADQLGSDHAPVRLAGIYALERLGDDHPDQQPTIMAVLCAYLRMPFDPPNRVPLVGPPTLASRRQLAKSDAATDPELAVVLATTAEQEREREQELEVRKAIQDVIVRHLGSGDGAGVRSRNTWLDHGNPLSLDLSGATLVQFTMCYAEVSHVDFSSVRFFGNTVFEGTIFRKFTDFRDSQFRGYAWFNKVRFLESAVFSDSRIEWTAHFFDVKFTGMAFFSDVHFGHAANFAGSRCDQKFDITNARFNGPVTFEDFEPAGAWIDARGCRLQNATDPHQFVMPPGWTLGTASEPTGWRPLIPLPVGRTE